MAILTAAVTALTLAGTPGLATWRDNQVAEGEKAAGEVTRLSLGGTPSRRYGSFSGKSAGGTFARTYAGNYTRLVPSGTPGIEYGSFGTKSASASDAKAGADTLVVVLTEGPFDGIDAAASDVLIPRITEGRTLLAVRVGADTLIPRITDTVLSLSKGGTTAKSASDTLVPRITESASYRVAVAAADTLVLVITDGAAVVSADARTASDTLVPVITEGALLDSVMGARSFTLTDTLRVVLADSARAAAVGEVDRIRIILRPCGRIRITEA